MKYPCHRSIILEAAVGSQKPTQALGASRTIKKCLITHTVTTNFLISPCTPIPYASFLHPTAVSRIIKSFLVFIALLWIPLSHIDTIHAEFSETDTCQSQVEHGSQIGDLQHVLTSFNHPDDYTPLIATAGKAHMVLIGDSTHGSHEFYLERINISKRLIKEQNFTLIAIEGNWPNVNRLNQYIHSLIPIPAMQVMETFNQYPDWLWKNKEMLDFIQWLREHNRQIEDSNHKVSLYGMDIFGIHRSRQLVIEYLKKISIAAAKLAEQRYECFSAFNNDMDQYGQAVNTDLSLSCEPTVKQQYLDFIDCQIPCPDPGNPGNREAFFQAQQNALIVKNTEQKFRVFYQTESQVLSWNVRDQHMQESLNVLQQHLNNPKTIIWAHSSHLGDALATDMATYGQLNLGQLIRQQYPNQVFSIGMLTYAGHVVASDDWGSPAKVKVLLPAHQESNSALFHQWGVPRFLLFLQQPFHLTRWLNSSRLQRHVGVVYLPEEEMDAHYSHTHLVDQFDAILFIDVTTALVLLSTD